MEYHKEIKIICGSTVWAAFEILECCFYVSEPGRVDVIRKVSQKRETL